MNIFLSDPARRQAALRPPEGRKFKNVAFLVFCISTAVVSVVVLLFLIGAIVFQGAHYLSWTFLSSPPSPDTDEAGIWPALGGTVWVCIFCALFTLPLGVATAIFLEEFKPKNRVARTLHGFVQLNMTNLAGVPSVVYGMLGLSAFVAMFGLFGSEKSPGLEIGVHFYDQFLTAGGERALVPVEDRSIPETTPTPGLKGLVAGKKVELNVISPTDPLPDDEELLARTLRTSDQCGRLSFESWYYLRLPFGRSVITGSLTLMLVVLPIVIIASQESIRAVPDSLREAALGMGCTRWQMVRRVTLPAAMPGILTGSILAMSRAMGEAAPILMIAGVIYIPSAPDNLIDEFTVMPLQVYNWAQRPQAEFHALAATGIILLLTVLLMFNAVAITLRQVWQKPLS